MRSSTVQRARVKHVKTFFQKINSNYHTIDRNPNATIEVLVTNYVPQISQENLLFA